MTGATLKTARTFLILASALATGCAARDLRVSLDASQAELTECKDKLNYCNVDSEVTTEAALWAERLLASYTKLAAELRAALNDENLVITIRGDRMVLRLPTAIYFERGKTVLQPEGKAILDKIAPVLAGYDSRRFLVAAHTDDEPISAKSKDFHSNLQLSALRAVAAFEYLTTKGMDPKLMAATGYGEFLPVAPNDTEEGRALNRRLEIVIMPTAEDLPELPDRL